MLAITTRSCKISHAFFYYFPLNDWDQNTAASESYNSDFQESRYNDRIGIASPHLQLLYQSCTENTTTSLCIVCAIVYIQQYFGSPAA